MSAIRLKPLLTFSTAIVMLAAAGLPLHAQPFDYNSIGIEVTVEPAQVGQGSEGAIIEPAETAGITFGEVIKPEHEREDEAGGHWGGNPEFRIPFRVASDAELGQRDVGLKLKLQICDDMTGLCFRPTTIDSAASFEVVESSAQPQAAPQEKGQSSQAASTESAPLDESLKNWLQDAISGGQIWLALLIAFIAGILTSLTPCVYPMIPIIISYVSGRAEGKRSSGFFISLVLVLGIIITYTTLGVAAALTGSTFGSIGQNLWVQAAILLVLTAMGFSMLVRDRAARLASAEAPGATQGLLRRAAGRPDDRLCGRPVRSAGADPDTHPDSLPSPTSFCLAAVSGWLN